MPRVGLHARCVNLHVMLALCNTIYSLPTIIISTWQMIVDETEYTKDIEDLAVGFANTLRLIHSVNGDTVSGDLTDTVEQILNLVQNASAFVSNYISMTQKGEWGYLSSIPKVCASDRVRNRSLDKHLCFVMSMQCTRVFRKA